jgi:Sigma-70, region 4
MWPELDFDIRTILHAEIDRLPEAERLPVVLCDLQGLTYEQAASRLRSTVSTLCHRLTRTRKRLRERLARRGVTASALGVVIASSSAAVPPRGPMRPLRRRPAFRPRRRRSPFRVAKDDNEPLRASTTPLTVSSFSTMPKGETGRVEVFGHCQAT